MKKTSIPQHDLPVVGQAFNLAGECGIDAERVRQDAETARKLADEAADYQEKMQQKLSLCPGFVGCYPPHSVNAPGKVTVQPSAVDDAVDYLKRRFHVGNVGRQRGLGFTVEIIPRNRRSGLSGRARFAKLRPQQFEFRLEETM